MAAKYAIPASGDNVGVSRYRLYRNGSPNPVATVPGNLTSYVDRGLSAGTPYTYTVSAVDGAGNDSGQSGPPASAMTLATHVSLGLTDIDIPTGMLPAGSYQENGGTISVSGSGSDIWYDADQFNYAYRPLTGDGEIIARVTSQPNTDGWAKAGPMIRQSLTASSAHAMLQMTGGNGVQFQYRASDGAFMSAQSGSGSVSPRWLRLVRQGNQLLSYEAPDGNTWTPVGQVTIPMSNTVYIGFAITSHNTSALGTATFDNVLITSTSPQPTPTPAPVATNTPVPLPTNTPLPAPTNTPLPGSTNTPGGPTATPTRRRA